MVLPHKRCDNCRHFVHGSPSEYVLFTRNYGHCYQRLPEDQEMPPYPAYANSRGCELYSEKEFIPIIPIGSIATSTASILIDVIIDPNLYVDKE